MLVQIGAKQLCRHNVIKIGKRRLYALRTKRNLVTLKSDIMLTSNPPLNPINSLFSAPENLSRASCASQEPRYIGAVAYAHQKGFQMNTKALTAVIGAAALAVSVLSTLAPASAQVRGYGQGYSAPYWRRRLPRSARQSRRWLWRRQRLITPKRDLIKNTRARPGCFFMSGILLGVKPTRWHLPVGTRECRSVGSAL